MKTSLIWAMIAIAAIAMLIGITANVKYSIEENKKEYEIARRRVEEQIAAFRKMELAKTETKQPLKVVVDNEWNVEERFGMSA